MRTRRNFIGYATKLDISPGDCLVLAHAQTTLPKTYAGPPPADRALAVPDQHRPDPGNELPAPANRSAAVRAGISSAVSQREYAHTMVSTGSCTGLRTSPQPCLVGATGFEPVTPRL